MRSTRVRHAAAGCAALCSFAVAMASGAGGSLPLRARSRPEAVPAAARGVPIGKTVTIPPPLGLPPVWFPPDNPPTAETIALGRRLFFDKRLSVDGTISCASCHDPRHAFSDPRQFSPGVNDGIGKRQSMTVLNAAYHFTQFWDGRALTLEAQARGPVQDPAEMGHTLTGVERRLSADASYAAQFEKAFGPGRIDYEMVAKCLASYERTLLSGNSPFDRYYYGGDRNAMSRAAIRGLDLFRDITLDGPNCVSCHVIGKQYATFTEERFHNTGVAVDPKTRQLVDLGRSRVTGARFEGGKFKVPTLRNIALTAPYMHDGSMATLEETVDFYFNGGRPNEFLSGVMPHKGVPNIPAEKQAQAKKDLVEFMKALTGEMPKNATPPEGGQ